VQICDGALVVSSKELDWKYMLVILSAWLCLQIRRQDEVTMYLLTNREKVNFSRSNLLHGAGNQSPYTEFHKM
jgi:hypothetical protein